MDTASFAVNDNKTFLFFFIWQRFSVITLFKQKLLNQLIMIIPLIEIQLEISTLIFLIQLPT